jgi:hypothetical protein
MHIFGKYGLACKLRKESRKIPLCAIDESEIVRSFNIKTISCGIPFYFAR